MSVRISIAMSTYNGEKWIAEQLESLAAQTRLPDELVVRDDGSTDGTLQILEEFAKRAPFPVRLIGDGKNLGFAKSFWRAFVAATGDYVAFCDQDDFWFPSKIEVLGCEIERYNPSAIFHNWIVNDEVAGKSYPARIFGRRRLCAAMALGFPFHHLGCAMTVYKPLFSVWLQDEIPNDFDTDRPMAHDIFTSRIVNAAGGVLCIPSYLIRYRRHGSNTAQYVKKGALVGEMATRLNSALATTGYEHTPRMYGYFEDLFSSKVDFTPSGQACSRLARFCARQKRLYTLRHELLISRSAGERFRKLWQMMAQGDYGSRPKGGLGLKGFGHDLLRICRPHTER